MSIEDHLAAKKGRRVRHRSGGETMTDRSQTSTVDINKIMARYKKTGVISHWNHRQPVYGDVSMVTDFRDAVELADTTWDHFMELDAHIRQEADNDPGRFLEMLSSVEGVQELVDAGLKVEGFEPTPAPDAERVAEPEPVAQPPSEE